MSEVNLMVSQDCRQYQINVRYSVDVLVPVVDKLIVRAIPYSNWLQKNPSPILYSVNSDTYISIRYEKSRV